jgi:NCS1 family nucleobase:cation symporter-1
MTETDTEGLEPITDEQRSMSLSHYIPVWWSSLIIVQGFATAFFAVYPQGSLNITQAVTATVIGAVISALLFVLNGFWGYKKGIPFVAQSRASFGTRGSMLPNYIRVIPAVGWLGIGNWIGALGIQTITMTLWGFGNVWIYFALFTILNIALAWEGITSIKWFDSIAAGVIIVLLGYTLYTVVTAQEIPTETLNYSGTWGLPFYTVIAAIVGTAITGAINAADLSRHLENERGARTHILGHLFGIAPPMMYMAIVGIMFGIAATSANPVAAIMNVAPSPLLGVLMMIFVLAAQISSNLTLNLLPPAHVFQDSLGVSWKTGLIMTGILSILTFPWVLFSNGNIYYLFINGYSVFLGPILGVMMADYWVFRAENTELSSLYEKGPSSNYWFVRGFSITALISVGIGVLAGLVWLQISWMVGLPLGFASYVALRKIDLDKHAVSYLSTGQTPVAEAD